MTTIYINELMFKETQSHSRLFRVSHKLQTIIDKGFCEVNGCIFLKALFEARPNLANCYSDKTGREGFLNGIEVDLFCNKNYYYNAIYYSEGIIAKWKKQFPGKAGTLVISPNENGYHITICCSRNDEPQWTTIADNNIPLMMVSF